MPRYFPIEVTPSIQSSASDLVDCHWKKSILIADFVIPEDEIHVLQICFEKAEVVRILDEMPLSTEAETTPSVGLISDHFAYSVEGALFWGSQSDALKTVLPKLRHFRLITGWTCLDVLSQQEPTFTRIAKSSALPICSVENTADTLS